MRLLLLAAFTALIFADGVAQRIPVVVHIVSRNPDNVTDQQVIEAIRDLNDAFAHAGLYQPLGPGHNTGISFCLARTDPMGGITTGITRTRHDLSDYDRDIEDKRMKALVSWDTRRYCNIWYVEGLKNEVQPFFQCGEWERSEDPGYGTFLPGGQFHDGVAVTRFGRVLTHNVGHYLGLRHIYNFRDCRNDNCNTDGDGICDTPPMGLSAINCTPGPNTCSTDTLSGFSTDVPDLVGNFMNNNGCAFSFTKGQGDKMVYNLTTARSSLLQGNRCDPPCTLPTTAYFRRDKWFPVTGDTVRFEADARPGLNYRWTVDGDSVGDNSTSYARVFPATGSFEVTLKVFAGDPTCFASYSDKIIVGCGLMARFWPEKRIVASKDPLRLENVVFKNRSIGGTSFRWLLSHLDSLRENVIATTYDLDYIFRDSGTYWIRLAAVSAGCADTTEFFQIKVVDPTPDIIPFMNVDCYRDSLLQVSVGICNDGYATVPQNLPISFYDGNPSIPGTRKIDTTFFLPDSVKGICCSPTYTIYLRTGGRRLDSLYVVANDPGTSLPLRLPLTPLPESDYTNNIRSVKGIRFGAVLTPVSVLSNPFDILRFSASSTNKDPFARYEWTRNGPVNCPDCPSTSFMIGIYPDTLRLRMVSRYGCTDSAKAIIAVRPVHDYRIRIDSVDCYRYDSVVVDFTLCDTFFLGKIPKGLAVSFYDGDPALPGSRRLGPSYITPDSTAGKCQSYRHVISALRPGATLFAVANDAGNGPGLLPADTVLRETNYANNGASLLYLAETMTLKPMDTLVFRKSILPVYITSRVYDASSIVWKAGPALQVSCVSSCPSLQVIPLAQDTLRVSMLNRYGCILAAQAVIRVRPPDLTVDITRVQCFTNTSTRVSYRLCTGNGYDSLPKGLPVSFFSSDPRAGGVVPPMASYTLPSSLPRVCDTFSIVLPTPPGLFLYAAVNQRNTSRFPDTVLSETNFVNNVDTASIVPFSARILPRDTFVVRLSGFRLRTDVQGGIVTQYLWKPANYLNCGVCPEPVGSIPFTNQFTLQTRNEYACTYNDTVTVNTFSEGRLYIPNAITPNGDGRNDILYVIGNRDVSRVREFTVFDRFGQIVFQARDTPPNDPRYGWNAMRKGVPVASATFAYTARVVLVDTREQTVKGLVTVLR
jgi:gliding motility-associated-like protein